jgi:DNA-binding NarL/FixJ family response regulator
LSTAYPACPDCGLPELRLPAAALALKLTDRVEGEALSRGELEVLRQLVTGKSNKKIARITNTTEGTVKLHVTAVPVNERLARG